MSDDGNTIIVKVNGNTHLQETKYGQALLLDQHHAVFLKDSEVSRNYFGDEVKLTKDNFKVKEWGDWSKKGLIGDSKENHSFNEWKKVASSQQKAGNKVRWEKTAGEKKVGSFQKQAAKKKANKSKTFAKLTEADMKDTVTINGKTYVRKIAKQNGLI